MKRQCEFIGCENNARRNGLCPKHSSRQRRHGDPSLTTRLANGTGLQWLHEHKAFQGGECLIWPFKLDPKGRARLHFDGRSRFAASVMCEMVNGQAPTEAHQAAHTCGQGHMGCVSPRHLVWKTPKENQADRLAHGTAFPSVMKSNTSGYPGVGWHKRERKWRAYISENNRQKSLGFFNSFEEAVGVRAAETERRMQTAVIEGGHRA